MKAELVQINELLNTLDEDSLRMATSYIMFLASGRNKSSHIQTEAKESSELERRRKAFAELEEFRSHAKEYFPDDFDYNEAREEAMREKYGSFA